MQAQRLVPAVVVGLLSVALVVAVRLAVGFQLGEPPMVVLFVFPIAAAAWLGGLRAGLVTTLASVVVARALFFDEVAPLEGAHLVALLGAGAVVSVVTHRLRRSEVELEQQERASRASVERFQQLLTSTPAAVAMFDRQMRYLGASLRYRTDYGLGPGELVGRSHYEVFPEIGEPLKQIHQRCLAGATERGERERFVRQDGRVDWVRWEVQPWRDDAGAIGGVILFSELITEQVERETKLRAAVDDAVEARNHAQRTSAELTAALQALSDSVVIFDMAGQLVLGNLERTQPLGLEAQTMTELRQLVVLDLHGQPLPPGENPGARVLRGEVVSGQYRVRNARGLERIFRINGSPVRDATGLQVLSVLVGRDVTERWEAITRVTEERERLAVTLRSISEAVITTDEVGHVTLLNPAAEALVGTDASQAVGQPIEALFSLLDAQGAPCENPAHAALRTGAPVMLAEGTRLRRADGVECPLADSAAPIRTNDGRVVGAVLVCRDQRPELATRRALVEGEARTHAMFEQAAVGVLLVDRETNRVREANQRVCELLGYTADELRGMSWHELTFPDDLPTDRASVAALHATGVPVQRIKRYRRKGGGEVWATLHLSLITTPGEGSTAQLALITDLSALKRSEAMLGAIAASVPGVIFSYRRAPDGQRGVEFCTAASTDVFGLPPEAIRRDFTWAVAGFDAGELERLSASAEVCTKTLAPFHETMHYRHPTRGPRLLETWAVPRREPDGSCVFDGFITDVSEQRALTEKFHAAQKFESLGRLAGGVAHDFNNLLTVILSGSGALKADLAEGRPLELEALEEIHAAGERAKEVTQQLLAFARKQVVAPTTLDLNGSVRKSEKLLTRLLGEDIRLATRLAPGLWPTVLDPGQLEQVLLNLAVNARDAMPRGGALTIETRNATRGGRDQVLLTVTDTGEGMTAEVRAHLFEPFYTTKREGRGTGLGLSTVYGVVTQAGGEVQVDSEPGEGTRFELSFPRATGLQLEEPAPALRVRGGTETLLVVEDDASVRATMGRALREAGYQLLLAGNGEEALELVAAHRGPIDLVLTDVVMPKLDGRALVEELRRRGYTTRALFVSGYTADVIRTRGDLPPDTELLDKPFTGLALRQRVRQALDRPS